MSKPDRKPKYPLVLVEWVDSTVDGGWNDVSGYMERECLTMQSVGWMTVKDARRVQVVQSHSWSQNDKCSDAITIPRGCVKRIRKLKV